MASITAIQGIADAKVKKLREAGIRTTDDLLAKANTSKRREKLAADTTASEKQLLTWATHADLMRVKGVSGSSAQLLGAAGVSSVKDLKSSDAETLAAAMDKKNSARKNPLVARAPSAKVVQKWIDQAKPLKPIVRQ